MSSAARPRLAFLSVLLLALGMLLIGPATGSAALSGVDFVRSSDLPGGPPAGAAPAGSPSSPSAPTAPAAPAGTKSPAIIGGTEATIDRFPWQVQITREGSPHCGGTLIHPRIVLTAAHCLVDDNRDWYPWIEVFAGRSVSGFGGTQLQAGYHIIPQEYDVRNNLGNDYGLITLGAPAPAGATPIQIAGGDERAVWKAGRTGLASGYGLTSEGGQGSDTLRQVDMPFVDDAACGSAYGSSFMVDVMFCAGHQAGGKSTCQGDSGGPLVAPIDGGGVRAVGAVSWAQGCAKPGFPTVFARVAEPAVSAKIVKTIGDVGAPQYENFSAAEKAHPVVGSGAKPFGCGAAFGAAGAAAAKAKAAGKMVTKAQRAAKKAKKKGSKARRKAAKKLKAARKKAKTAKAASRRAAAGAAAACN